MLALPLTAVVLLQATPSQMGVMTAMELLPFVLLSLPGGVFLDRRRKLPIFIAGELLMGAFLLLIPLAWWLGFLSMPLMYGVAFCLGCAVNQGPGDQINRSQAQHQGPQAQRVIGRLRRHLRVHARLRLLDQRHR